MINSFWKKSIHRALPICLLLAALLWGACSKTASSRIPSNGERGTDPPPSAVMTWGEIAGRRIKLEIADTTDLRADGLAGRKSLGQDCGMIFVYGEADERAYWMRGCEIGLDIAFLDEAARLNVVYSVDPPRSEDEALETYSSGGKARYVVEMTKGWFAAHQIRRGARLQFSPLLQRRADALARSKSRQP